MPEYLKKARCPYCKRLLEFCREDAGKVVACPHCRSELKIARQAFAKEDAAQRQADELARQREEALAAERHASEMRRAAEEPRNVRNEGFVLARGQLSHALSLALRVFVFCCFYPMFFLMGSVFLFRWDVPFLRVSLSLLGIAFIIALVVLAVKLPYYILDIGATKNELERMRRRDEELAEARRAAEERERARSYENEKVNRAAQLERERAEIERQRQLSDASSRECWYKLGWWDFEVAVLLAFEHSQPCEATTTQPTKDAGLDGILQFEAERAGVQCKHLSRREFVQSGEIQAFLGALLMAKMRVGFFVTTGQYGKAALALAGDSENRGIVVKLLHVDNLTEMGRGLALTREAIAQAKRRWNVPQDPPRDMPQGPQRTRQYRRRGHW